MTFGYHMLNISKVIRFICDRVSRYVHGKFTAPKAPLNFPAAPRAIAVAGHIFIAGIWLLGIFCLLFRFVPNLNDSLPDDAYLMMAIPGVAPKGYAVAFERSVNGTIGFDDRMVVKRVIGTAGDPVWVTGNQICFDFHCLTIAPEAIELGYRPLMADQIPEGHVAVAGDHPLSLDSRYSLIGLVPLPDIRAFGWGMMLPRDGFLERILTWIG